LTTPSEFEQRLLDEVTRQLADGPALHDRATGGAIALEQVQIDGEYPGRELRITMRDLARPGCLFGLRARIWDDEGEPAGRSDHFDDPDSFAMVLVVHLTERILTLPGLPQDCLPGEVTWVSGGEVTFFE
jgi:hypothetical protein